MTLLIFSFFAGILTVLAPCVLPLLPIIIGSSAGEKNIKKVVVITVSLGISIILFTLLLKASTLLIEIDPKVWTSISGGLLIVLGVFTIFPHLWETISLKLNLSTSSNKFLDKSAQKDGYLSQILTGIALGPVFSSCSPTYFLILITVLPVSFFKGIIYLIAYAAGLSFIMFLIGIFGQAIVKKLKWAANPSGKFKKILGIIFIIVGLLIAFGTVKKIETYLVEKQIFDVTKIESKFLDENSDSLGD